jgi:hypothetical protein
MALVVQFRRTENFFLTSLFLQPNIDSCQSALPFDEPSIPSSALLEALQDAELAVKHEQFWTTKVLEIECAAIKEA